MDKLLTAIEISLPERERRDGCFLTAADGPITEPSLARVKPPLDMLTEGSLQSPTVILSTGAAVSSPLVLDENADRRHLVGSHLAPTRPLIEHRLIKSCYLTPPGQARLLDLRTWEAGGYPSSLENILGLL